MNDKIAKCCAFFGSLALCALGMYGVVGLGQVAQSNWGDAFNEARKKGYDAREAGVPVEANPYDTVFKAEWQEGWVGAPSYDIDAVLCELHDLQMELVESGQ